VSCSALLTEHFPRSTSGPAGVWEPIRAPWALDACKGLPPLRSSNEPIGPFSSVNDERDPLRLGIAAAVTYVSGTGAYVLHTGAGIRGGGRADRKVGRPPDIARVPGIDAILRALQAVRRRLPADVASWRRFDAAAANDLVTARAARSLVAAYGARKDGRFVLVPFGTQGAVTLRAAAAVEVEVFDPRTGERRGGGAIAAGGTLVVDGLPGYIVVGRTAAPASLH
jgi:hypothetical protein